MEHNENQNSISPEEAGKILELFDTLEKRDKEVYADLDAAIKKVIEKHYPDIFNLEAQGYHQLNDRISRAIVSLRTEISNIIFRNKSK
jgi:hypothetical protein